jgi:hypothetical protein
VATTTEPTGTVQVFDPVEAARLLALLHEPDDSIRVFAWQDESKKPLVDEVEARGHGDQQLWQRIAAWQEQRMAVAVSLASFVPGMPRRKQFARRLRVLGIDIDQKHGKVLAPGADTPEDVARVAVTKLAKVGLRPHFIVGSGRGVHVYFRVGIAWVDFPEVREDVETIWWKLGNLLGGATEKHDVSSVLRLPGTFNFKEGQRRPVRFLSGIAGLAGAEVHGWKELRAAAAALPGRPPPSKEARVFSVMSKGPVGSPPGEAGLAPGAQALDFALRTKSIANRRADAHGQSDDRSRADFSYSCELVRLGFGQGEICSELGLTSKGRSRSDLYRDSTSLEAFSEVYGDLTNRYLREISFRFGAGEAFPLILKGHSPAEPEGGVVCGPLESPWVTVQPVFVTMSRAGDGKTTGLFDAASLRQALARDRLVVAGLFTGELLRHEAELNAAWPGGRAWIGGDGELFRWASSPRSTAPDTWASLQGPERKGHAWTEERFKKTVRDPDAFAINMAHPSFADESLYWQEDEDGIKHPPAWLPQNPEEALKSKEQWQPFAVTKFSPTSRFCIAGYPQSKLRSPRPPCGKCEFTSCRANTNTDVQGSAVGAKTLWKSAPLRLMTHSGFWTQQVLSPHSVSAAALVLDELPDQVFRMPALKLWRKRGRWTCRVLDPVIDFLKEVGLSSDGDKRKACDALREKLQQRLRLLVKTASNQYAKRKAVKEHDALLRADDVEPLLTPDEFTRLVGWHRSTRGGDADEDEDLVADDVGPAIKALVDFASKEPTLPVIIEQRLSRKGGFAFDMHRPVNGWPDFVFESKGNPRRVLILDATGGVDPRYLPLHGTPEERYPEASYPNTRLVLTAPGRSKQKLEEELAEKPEAVARRIATEFSGHAKFVRKLLRTEQRDGHEVKVYAKAKLLIVTAKKLRRTIAEEVKKLKAAGAFPHSFRVVHYGALRGRNDLRDFDAVYFTHLYRRPSRLYVGLAAVTTGFEGLPREWEAEDVLRRGRRDDDRPRHSHWELAEVLRWRWMACDIYQDAMRIALRGDPNKPTAVFIPSTDPRLVCRLLRFFPGAAVLAPGLASAPTSTPRPPPTSGDSGSATPSSNPASANAPVKPSFDDQLDAEVAAWLRDHPPVLDLDCPTLGVNTDTARRWVAHEMPALLVAVRGLEGNCRPLHWMSQDPMEVLPRLPDGELEEAVRSVAITLVETWGDRDADELRDFVLRNVWDGRDAVVPETPLTPGWKPNRARPACPGLLDTDVWKAAYENVSLEWYRRRHEYGIRFAQAIEAGVSPEAATAALKPFVDAVSKDRVVALAH